MLPAAELSPKAVCEVVVREQEGLHEYTPPDGFTFNVNGQQVGVDQLPPGTTVGALITDKVITRNVVLTRLASATRMQVAPGGIVVKTADRELEGYNSKDAAGTTSTSRGIAKRSRRRVREGGSWMTRSKGAI